MHRSIPLALAGVCASLATASPAMAVDTTIRVEGADATIIPRTPLALPAQGSARVADRLDADVVDVPARSATAQLDLTARAAGVTLSFSLFDFGAGPTSFVTRIGPDETPADFSSSWTLRIDHAESQVGADDALLADGAQVLWAFGPPGAHELELTVPAEPIASGVPIPVEVRRYDGAGASAPAAGVSLRYGAATTVTDAAGRALLRADGAGPATIEASASGAIRDAAVVCTYGQDPAVCGVAAAAATAATAPRATPGGPLCRPVPSRPRTADPDGVRATRAQLRIERRIAAVARERARAVGRWLDAGIRGGDICGGALGVGEFALGAAAAGGATPAPTPPAPRTLTLLPGRIARGAPPLGARAASANRRLAIAAMREANAVRDRLRAGLTGGDVVDGAIGVGQLALRIEVASVDVAPAPRTRTARARAPRRVRVPLGEAGSRTTMRIAVEAMRRANRLVDRIRAGLTASEFADGSLGPSDLANDAR